MHKSRDRIKNDYIGTVLHKILVSLGFRGYGGPFLTPLFYAATVNTVTMAIPNKICPWAKVSATKVNRDLMQMSCHCVHESAPFIQLPSSL